MNNIKNKIFILCIFFIFPVIVFGAEYASETKSGSLSVTNSEGRSGYYYLPAGYNLATKPVLVLYHGTGGTGSSISSEFTNLASEHGFIIIAPDSGKSPAGDYTWNVGTAPGVQTEDYLHTLDCIAEVKAMDSVNFNALYYMAAGHSGGASSAPYIATNESRFTNFAILHGGVFTSGLGDNNISGWLSTGNSDTARTPSLLSIYKSTLEYAGYTDLQFNLYDGGHGLIDQEKEELIDWWLTDYSPGEPLTLSKVEGYKKGKIKVTYSDGSVSKYTIFKNNSTLKTTAIDQYKDTDYYVVIQGLGKKLALVNAYTGEVLKRKKLSPNKNWKYNKLKIMQLQDKYWAVATSKSKDNNIRLTVTRIIFADKEFGKKLTKKFTDKYVKPNNTEKYKKHKIKIIGKKGKTRRIYLLNKNKNLIRK